MVVNNDFLKYCNTMYITEIISQNRHPDRSHNLVQPSWKAHELTFCLATQIGNLSGNYESKEVGDQAVNEQIQLASRVVVMGNRPANKQSVTEHEAQVKSNHK